jgi:hypothetical protein
MGNVGALLPFDCHQMQHQPPSPHGAKGTKCAIWTSPDGSILLVVGFRGDHSAGMLDDGEYIPIPWSAANLSAAW